MKGIQMKLKTHNYLITVLFRKNDINIQSCFIVKAVPMNQIKAQKIAEILYPEYDVVVESIKNEN